MLKSTAHSTCLWEFHFALSHPLRFTASKFSLNLKSSICACVCFFSLLFIVIGFDERQFWLHATPCFLRNIRTRHIIQLWLALKEILLNEYEAYEFLLLGRTLEFQTQIYFVTFKIQMCVCVTTSETKCHLFSQRKQSNNEMQNSKWIFSTFVDEPSDSFHIYWECHSIQCHRVVSIFNIVYHSKSAAECSAFHRLSPWER